MAPRRSTRNTKRKVTEEQPVIEEEVAVATKKPKTKRASAKTSKKKPPSPDTVVLPKKAAPKKKTKPARKVAAEPPEEETAPAKYPSAKQPPRKDKSKASHPIDEAIHLHGGSAANYEVVTHGDTVYDAVLNQCNISSNNNKYYRLQVVQNTSGHYYCWQRWGRVGEHPRSRSSALKGPHSVDGAIREFMSKFRSKTGNVFGANEFVPKSGKYTLIEIDNDVEVDEDFQVEPAEEVVQYEYKPSKLDKKTQELMQAIFSKDMRDAALVTFNLDPKRLPLGVPSQEQIDRGIAVLNAIENKLEGGDLKESYVSLSSRFYTAIPHSFGRGRPPTISTPAEVQSRYDMCNILLDMYSTTETLRNLESKKPKTTKKLLTPKVDEHYDTLKADLNVIDHGSDEFKLIQTYFEQSKHSSSHSILLNAWSVDRQGEAARHGAFDDVGNRALLWHGTNIAVVAPIVTNGLRIMPHSGGRVGAGIYLANMQQKSAQYTSAYGSRFACMFLCEAPLGKQFELNSDGHHASSLRKAPSGHDSVHAIGAYGPTNWQTMKIDGNDIAIPQGSGKNTGKSSTFQHDEYLVYDEAQVRLRYVLTVAL